MSEKSTGTAAVKIILSLGFVIVLIMIVGFGGVFLLNKYNYEQQQRAAEIEAKRQEQKASSERLAAIGSAIGEKLGDKMATKLGDSDAQALKEAAAKLGEKIGEDFGKPGKADELKETLKAAGESITAEIIKQSNADTHSESDLD